MTGGSIELWKAVLALVGTVVGAVLLYKGAKLTGARAVEGTARTAEVDEQQSALTAWKELLAPVQTELARARAEAERFRIELDEEREQRRATERRTEEERAAAKKVVSQQMDALQAQVDKLRDEVKVWKRVAQTIARWATSLRDEVLRLGGTVPATPDELLTLQAIQETEQS